MATIKAKAVNLNIEIERGTTFDETILFKDAAKVPIDLTGYTAAMHIRPEADSATLTKELSTANGEIVLNTPVGGIRIIIDHTTSTSVLTEDSYEFDLELTYPTGRVRKLFFGSMPVFGEVTR